MAAVLIPPSSRANTGKPSLVPDMISLSVEHIFLLPDSYFSFHYIKKKTLKLFKTKPASSRPNTSAFPAATLSFRDRAWSSEAFRQRFRKSPSRTNAVGPLTRKSRTSLAADGHDERRRRRGQKSQRCSTRRVLSLGLVFGRSLLLRRFVLPANEQKVCRVTREDFSFGVFLSG